MSVPPMGGPGTYVYEPEVNSQIYGAHVPYTKGYDAYSTRNFPRAENKSPSGYLQRGDGSQIALWLTDITADFSLSGTLGQSRMQREFYTRSFNDVTLTLTGNVSNQYEYNRLALFVREHQWKALNYINQGGTGVDQTITFVLFNNTPALFNNPFLKTVKGPHRPWQTSGYISSISAGATAHEVAPQFKIQFIVATSVFKGEIGVWRELLEDGSVLNTFVQLVNAGVAAGDIFTGFVGAPLVAPSPKAKVQKGPVPDPQNPLDIPPPPWSLQVAIGTASNNNAIQSIYTAISGG